MIAFCVLKLKIGGQNLGLVGGKSDVGSQTSVHTQDSFAYRADISAMEDLCNMYTHAASWVDVNFHVKILAELTFAFQFQCALHISGFGRMNQI